LMTRDPEKARQEMARHLEVSFYNAARVLDASARRKSDAAPKILPDHLGA
jgi:DNA-binding GntR family transcriptional regulator